MNSSRIDRNCLCLETFDHVRMKYVFAMVESRVVVRLEPLLMPGTSLAILASSWHGSGAQWQWKYEITVIRSTQKLGSFWSSADTISSLEEEAKVGCGEPPPCNQIPTQEELPNP